MTKRLALAGALLALLAACSEEKKPEPAPPASALAEETTAAPDEGPRPPAPPILETFDREPQLSLFARIGDFRPEDSDELRLPYWNTYIEHLVKTSGIVARDTEGNRAYALRGIKSIDSVGFFAPLAVSPATSYRVSFKIKTELPEGASAGVGVIEYDEFLWVAEQYPQSLDKIHRSGQHAGVRAGGRNDWVERSFQFTTGFNTRMVHLVLFREGPADRNQVVVDDIAIRKVGG